MEGTARTGPFGSKDAFILSRDAVTSNIVHDARSEGKQRLVVCCFRPHGGLHACRASVRAVCCHIQDGIATVKNILAQNYVRPDEAENTLYQSCTVKLYHY